MWTVKLSIQAKKFIDSISGKHRNQLDAALGELSRAPQTGNALKGELKGYWSYRVGIYRIIYVIRNQEVIVEVLRIHHRKEVYEKLKRI